MIVRGDLVQGRFQPSAGVAGGQEGAHDALGIALTARAVEDHQREPGVGGIGDDARPYEGDRRERLDRLGRRASRAAAGLQPERIVIGLRPADDDGRDGEDDQHREDGRHSSRHEVAEEPNEDSVRVLDENSHQDQDDAEHDRQSDRQDSFHSVAEERDHRTRDRRDGNESGDHLDERVFQADLDESVLNSIAIAAHDVLLASSITASRLFQFGPSLSIGQARPAEPSGLSGAPRLRATACRDVGRSPVFPTFPAWRKGCSRCTRNTMGGPA